jgi:hypothetical protein
MGKNGISAMRSILSTLHLSSAKKCAYNGLCAAW